MAWLISNALYEKWRSSQGLEVESSEAICLDGKPSAPLSGSHTQQAYCAPDKMTAFSRLSRFGMTYKPLMADHGEDLLTWFRAGFLAKTYQVQERALELTEPGQACGSTWHGLLARYSHDLCSWKTVQCSLVEDLELYSEIWPRWGSMRNGGCWEAIPLGRRISANEFGLLPTPSGTSNHGKNHVSGRLDEWGGSSNPWRGTEIGRTHCASFEEWVMGWPVLWTELTPLETGKFQSWLQQHSEFLQATSNS